MAGPEFCAATDPVRTKMPVPMMAPIPSAIRFVAPSARLRVCSPTSSTSSLIMLRGFLTSRSGMVCVQRNIYADACAQIGVGWGAIRPIRSGDHGKVRRCKPGLGECVPKGAAGITLSIYGFGVHTKLAASSRLPDP